jgi:cytochrome c oxidase cbb3-type subunit 3/ubiquinol-cytochrome c reductase cytochrome c subunit
MLGLSCGRNSSTPTRPSANPSTQAAPVAPVAKQDPVIAAGERSYQHYCQLCHAKDGTGYAADNAPSLVSQTFLESASDELIAAGIRLGRPGTAMAAYGKVRGGPLDDAEINAIVRFLRAKGPAVRPLPPAPAGGNPANGPDVFAKNCQSCHPTPHNRGTALDLFNPELLRAATPAFYRYAIVNGRPPTPMPAFQGKLSEQEISDVIAWIWGFKPAAATPPVQKPTVPDDLPIVINPKGSAPQFTLRAERFVSAAQVKKALDLKQRIVLIDARSPSDWIQFRIPGAVPVPYHDHTQLERIPNDGTWVVAYCACPHHASGEVVDALRKRNYKHTAVLDEGILFWRDQGYPLEGEAVKPGAIGAPNAALHSVPKVPGSAKPKTPSRPPARAKPPVTP